MTNKLQTDYWLVLMYIFSILLHLLWPLEEIVGLLKERSDAKEAAKWIPAGTDVWITLWYWAWNRWSDCKQFLGELLLQLIFSFLTFEVEISGKAQYSTFFPFCFVWYIKHNRKRSQNYCLYSNGALILW